MLSYIMNKCLKCSKCTKCKEWETEYKKLKLSYLQQKKTKMELTKLLHDIIKTQNEILDYIHNNKDVLKLN